MSLNEEYQYHNVNDTYNVREDWKAFKECCNEFEEQLVKFLSHTKNKAAGVRARKKLKELRDRSHQIGKKILKKKQDYDSDYTK